MTNERDFGPKSKAINCPKLTHQPIGRANVYTDKQVSVKRLILCLPFRPRFQNSKSHKTTNNNNDNKKSSKKRWRQRMDINIYIYTIHVYRTRRALNFKVYELTSFWFLAPNRQCLHFRSIKI